MTALYTVLMLIFTSVLCMKDSYPGNLWSETAAMLGYSELGKNLQVPSTVRVMESISPYGCMLQAVSYTHLDVYKRQGLYSKAF